MSANSAMSAKGFWQTWALSVMPTNGVSAVSAESANRFLAASDILHSSGFVEIIEITEFTVSTFELGEISGVIF